MKVYAAKLERSNRELEQFATIASHDLQAPLRKVILFSDFLKTAGETEKLSEESRDYIDRIQNATRRMQHLITDLLSLSRVHRKGQPFRRVDLTLVTREAIADLDELIISTSGEVKVGDMPAIDADPTQMQQLMQNLIGNAMKFHRKGVPPVVTVNAELVNKRICELRISDNGIGFDQKYTDRIFDVFERLHGDSEYEGTGIGLAICSKIAERHAGSITAQSKPGEGTTFIVQLPVKQSQTRQEEFDQQSVQS